MTEPKLPNKIPFPACWNDDERMAVLFAPFRVREVNPENYDSKMKFWQDMIALYCTETGTVIFSKIDVQTAFARGSSIPYGLDTVIDELLRSKKIRLRTEYEYDPQNGWTSWAMNGLLWRPLAWSVFKLKSLIGFEDQKTTSGHIEYVHLNTIQMFCKELQSRVLQHNVGKLMHYVDFTKIVETAGIKLTNDSLELCVRTLQCHNSLVLEYKKELKCLKVHLVKIPSPDDINSASITETDHAIHNLQMTQNNLVKQLEDLDKQITLATEKVRECLKENKRQRAKSHLRKKHLLEKSYEKRSVALQNIEELLNSVNEAGSQGKILDAYKIGARALQNVLNTSGLRYDNVDEVIADVRETLDSQREIEDTMSNATLSDASLTANENDQLERELKDLFEENTTTTTTTTNKPTNVISAPNNTPSSLEVTITDTELLAMLDKLEVEDESPEKPNQNQKLAA